MADDLIPPLPPARGPGQDGGRATIAARYEDITQDGRIQLTALMPGLGGAVWRALLSQVPAMDLFRAQGILPILRRLVAVGEDRSVSVNVPIEYTGSFRFAREKDGDRLFANMWVEAYAPVASTLGPTPPRDAPRELLGRVFAEHVITRPFAPPAERKVTRLDAPGVPAVPEDEHVFESAEALIESAGGPLDEAGDFVFGMMHTDSNQHVNSLVYPRIFEEAASRRLVQDARIPSPHALLARATEMRWRRPFFAGERAHIGMRLSETAGGGPWKVAAIGAFRGEGPKPSSAVKMLFR
ncbi:MAG: hypothetical protein JWP87_3679 [Labilithrix sp.]|nr:hypothetical protein [Labilithrix sp.]